MSKVLFITIFSMCAFAANSLLCRLALRDAANSPVSFTVLRLFSGALLLSVLLFKQEAREYMKLTRASVVGPVSLFLYAIFFSLSYVNISAGAGALILFACVQLTMMIVALLKGTKLQTKEKIGFALAGSGLIYLLLPSVDVPPLASAVLMALAGVSWGFYTLSGQGIKHPTLATARNFVFTAPLILPLYFFSNFQLSEAGIIYGILSGAITSGLGYVLWYTALKDISTSTAAIVQLSVPALAAIGGILFLGETVKMRLVIASALILGGIYLKVRKPTIN